MRINVKGGTPKKHEESLCKTCTYFKYRKGNTENSEQIGCRRFEDYIPLSHVTECTDYYEKNQASLYDMQQMAHVLVVDKKKNFGFVRYAEWKKAHENEELLPGHDL